jgi:hypothetical protein
MMLIKLIKLKLKFYKLIMRIIAYIIHKFKSKDLPIHLGRWRIESCNIKINNKIDLSNEDYCGPCGQYVLDKVKLNNNIKEIKIEKCNTST